MGTRKNDTGSQDEYEGRSKRLYDLDPDLFFDDFCKRLKRINEDSTKRLSGGQK